MLKPSYKTMSLLIALGAIWSLGFSIARYCTTNGVHPLGYAFWQSLGPAVVLTILCKCLRIPIFNHRSYFIFYLFASLVGIAIPNANMYFAASQLPSGILAVIINISPMVTYLLALAFKEESFNSRRFAGVICAVLGIIIMIKPSGDISKEMIPWLLSALLTPISFALCAVFVAKYRPENSHSLGLAAGMLWGSTLWLLPVVFLGHHFYALSHGFSWTEQLLLIEVLLSSAGYWLFFQLLKNAGPVYYSLVGGVVAVAGLLWGKLLFAETLTLTQMAGVTAVILGIVLVSRGDRS
ncbi:MAG: DMT family transporter [Gammaproteobacteria bacterium]|nr:DMT family transporter [Gammaproteobacteria bacterium]